MQVAFDVTPVASGRTGIARYVTQLGAALRESGVELRRFALGRGPFPVPADARRVGVPGRVLERWWSVTHWPRVERLCGRADLVHVTGLVIPPTALPLVITVHDLAALRFPELHPSRNVLQQRSLLRHLRGADAVVAVSQATADDLAHSGVPSERIIVAPLGLSPRVGVPHEPPETRACRPADLAAADKSGQGARPATGFLLTVGETAPRKNYGVLLHALARITGPRLVIAGPPSADEPRISSLITELDIRSRVSRLRSVSDPELTALYHDALALCFPSVAEGFGLPVLEAMGAGLPVLASDIPVMHELAGDAALYAPSGDERAWAEAIEAVVADPALRADLAMRGRKRAAEFTWERTAELTIGAYRAATEIGVRLR